MATPPTSLGGKIASGVHNVKVSKRIVESGRKRPELLRKVRARQRRIERERKPLAHNERSTQIRNSNRIQKISRGVRWATKAATSKKGSGKIKAVAATSSFIVYAGIAYFVQLGFAITSFLGLSLEASVTDALFNIFHSLSPGFTIFLFFHFIAFIIGTIVLWMITSVYLLRGVSCMKGWGMFWFIICSIGLISPLGVLFPWTWVWVAVVVMRA